MKSKLIVKSYRADRYAVDVVHVGKFPGGEVNVIFPTTNLSNDAKILAWIHDSDGIIALAQLKSIIDETDVKNVELVLGYVPYARQDRICNPGESLAIKVFASMINAMNFDKVTIIDPHSDVTPALISNVKVIPKEFVLNSANINLSNYDCFVAPDAGATKEVQKLCIKFNKEFIQGSKIRDTKTGELSGFDYQGNIEGKRVLIVDDLCDAGGTFIGLANALKKGNPQAIDLFVTHGMFTKGLNLLQATFNRIYTTNTYVSDIYKNTNVKCLYKMGEI